METAGGWFDELDLNPLGHPVSMGTRNLGDRPWLIADGDKDRDLALKRTALVEQRDNVAWLTDDSTEAAHAVLALVGADPEPGRHPLETAALSVQDDVCLLRRDPEHWWLDASVVCFPTHWHLPSKVGRPIGVVHDPVGGYHERIAARVTRLFDRLTERPVWRRNWSFTEDTELFQPAYRTANPIVPADRLGSELFVRSERQTLRLVSPNWVLFTIRIQMLPLGELLTTEQRRSDFVNWVEHVPSDLGLKRHLGDEQRRELLTALRS